jgi:hypothetical protein
VYDPVEFLLSIDAAQPPKERLGKGYITAKLVTADKLRLGDFVYLGGMEGEVPEAHEIIGFGKPGQIANGTNVEGMPYIGKYGRGDGRLDLNINNYLRYKDWNGETILYRKARKPRKKKLELAEQSAEKEI